MKMKGFGPPDAPLGSANDLSYTIHNSKADPKFSGVVTNQTGEMITHYFVNSGADPGFLIEGGTNPP